MPEKNSVGAAGTASTACTDADGDGFGENCPAGPDCNDSDATNTTQCFGACSRPSEGCACLNDAPVPCFLDETANADGTTMCHEGTRHCTNGMWGACGNVHSYSVQPRQDTRLLADVVRRPTCSDCELNCFVAADPLAPDSAIAPYADPDLEQIPAGGVTIAVTLDGGIVFPEAGPDMYRDAAFTVWPPAGPTVCPGPLDDDCDNVPDNYDIDSTDINRPFFSLHEPIVLTTPSTASVGYLIDDFVFRLPAADVYFMLDVTRSQNVERQAFINAVNDLGGTSVTDSLVDDIAGFAYNCVDSDGDGNSVNENAAYKSSGLLGAIRCFTGDPNYGVGFMDEVPVKDSCSLTYGGFLGWGATTWTECHFGEYASGAPTVPFRNLLDVNPSDAVLRSAVWRLPTIATRLEIPQAGTQALWALSAGGAGDLYYGPDRPAFGARRDCPAGTQGGACFRSGVVPITFMFTDTGQHNGPLNYTPTGYKPPLTANSTPTWAGAPYIANNLALGQPDITRWGTPHAGGERARNVTGGETQYTAVPISATALVNQRLTITGSTIGMTSNITPAEMGGCGAAGTPDAFFGFTLPPGPNTSVRVGLVSTGFDSDGNSTTPPGVYNKTLSLFSPPAILNVPITMGVTNISPINGITPRNYNDDGTVAYGLVPPTYLSSVSGCGAHGINGVGIATNERRITFTPTANMTLVADVSGSGAGAVIDLYQGAPPANPTVTPSGDANNSYADAVNINLTSNPSSPGYQSFSGSTLSTPASTVPDTDLGCGFGTGIGTNDAVYGFHLDNPSTVTIDTEGSALDTVLSLHTFATLPNQSTTVTAADANSSAGFLIPPGTTGLTTLNGFKTTLTGATDGSLATYVDACFGNNAADDHLIAFTLDTAAQIRVPGTTHPPVAIYAGTKPPSTYARTNDADFGTTGATPATAYDFNVPAVGDTAGIANRTVDLNGLGTAAGANALSTVGKGADLRVQQFSTCSALPADNAEDVVFHFNSPSAITGATFTIDGENNVLPMMALFNSAPRLPVDLTTTNNDTWASAHPVTLDATAQVFRGTTAGKNPDYSEYGVNVGIECNTAAGALDAVYQVTVPGPGPQNVTFRTHSRTGGYDSVIRLFPQRSSGVAAEPWRNVTLTTTEGATDIAVGTAPDLSGGIARVSGTFGGGSATADNSNFPGACVGQQDSRDVFYSFRLTRPATLWMHAWGGSNWDGASFPAIQVFNRPPTAAAFNTAATVPTNVQGGAAVTCRGADGSQDAYYNNDLTLAPGEYYVVLKAVKIPGGFGGNANQNDPYTLDIVDVSDGSNTTSPQVQVACGDDNGVGSDFVSTNLAAGTYDLVVTSSGGAGEHLLSVGPTTATGTPTICSRSPLPGGPTATGVSESQANSSGDANSNPLPSLQNAWIRKDGDFGQSCGAFCGNAWGGGDDSDGCGAEDDTRDAFFRFTIGRTSRLRFDAWADNDSNVGVTIVNEVGPFDLNGRPTDVKTGVAVECSSGADSAAAPRTIDVQLLPGTYYAIVKAHKKDCGFACDSQDDPFHLEIRDLTEQTFTTNITAGTDYYLVVKGMNANSGNYRLRITGTTVPPTTCVAANVQGTTPLLAASVTHYALVKGGAVGPYSVDLIDQTAANAFGMIECNDNAGIVGAATGPGFLGGASRISRSLPAGDYKVVVTSANDNTNNAYRLNIRDDATANDNAVACAAASGTPTFSAALTAGQSYTAIIKGQNNATPAFSTILSDPSATLVGSCYTPGTAVSLPAGNHVIGLKGASAGLSGSGAYQLTVEAGSAIPAATAAQRAFASKQWPQSRAAVTAAGMKVVPMQSCEPLTDWGTGLGITTNTGPGGGGSFQSCGFYFSGPLAWLMDIIVLALGGIPFFGCLIIIIVGFILALFGLITMSAGPPTGPTAVTLDPFACNQGTAVAGEDSAAADALFASVQTPLGTNPMRGTWPQSKQIASDTGTVKTDGSPIAYWLRESPSSDKIAYDIAHALYRVTEDMVMDVSLVMLWGTEAAPTANPGYGVAIAGVAPTDCISVAGAVHRDCGNGDRPTFDVTFTNPPLAPIPLNMAPGWFGAWPGRLVIMGDGQFVLDEIPVLLIPPLPPMMPPVVTPSYAGPASYYQDIGTRECDGTTLPDWTDLYFNAEMPPGTRIVFEACAADVPGDLATCTMLPVTTVTATNVPCADDSACRGINGYCGSGGPSAPGGFCQILSPMKHKGVCGSEAECPDGVANGITAGNLLSDCNSGECEYDSQPADVGTALGGFNFRRWSRMRMTLYPSPDLTTPDPDDGAFAPNLLDWAVTYVCTPNQ